MSRKIEIERKKPVLQDHLNLQPTASHSIDMEKETLPQLLSEHLALVMFAHQPSTDHSTCAISGPRSTSDITQGTSWLMQSDRPRAQKKQGEKKSQIQLITRLSSSTAAAITTNQLIINHYKTSDNRYS